MRSKRILYVVVLCVAASGCKQTTVEGPGAKKLTLVKPSDTAIQRGNTAKVAVAVTRSNFNGPVTAEFKNLPRGVTLVDKTQEIESNERTFVLTAAEDAALVSNHVASVSLRGPDGMTATEEFRITVREKG